MTVLLSWAWATTEYISDTKLFKSDCSVCVFSYKKSNLLHFILFHILRKALPQQRDTSLVVKISTSFNYLHNICKETYVMKLMLLFWYFHKNVKFNNRVLGQWPCGKGGSIRSSKIWLFPSAKLASQLGKDLLWPCHLVNWPQNPHWWTLSICNVKIPRICCYFPFSLMRTIWK